jgi:hypothetical protein
MREAHTATQVDRQDDIERSREEADADHPVCKLHG